MACAATACWHAFPSNTTTTIATTTNTANTTPVTSGGFGAVALPGLAIGNEPAAADPLIGLRGLPDALRMLEAALSVGRHLPQMLLYRSGRALPKKTHSMQIVLACVTALSSGDLRHAVLAGPGGRACYLSAAHAATACSQQLRAAHAHPPPCQGH